MAEKDGALPAEKTGQDETAQGKQAAIGKRREREATAGILANLLLTVALILLVVLFIIVIWPQMRHLFIRFVIQMQQLFGSIDQFR